jgi:PPE-repeat protein
MMGAGPAPMLQAAAGWQALATALTAQSAELAAALASLEQVWTGSSSERAISAANPMVTWLRTAAAQAEQRAAQASAQAAAYTTALATTPTLPDIAANHITRAVLTATNFLGINTVPIGLKETDYFVRMWNQAATAMDVYQAQTTVNTRFEPLEPSKPILAPAAREAVDVAGELADAGADIPWQQAGQLATQYGGPVMQLGQQAFQQLQQMIQKAGGKGGLGGVGSDQSEEDKAEQVGLLGANPRSSHPLAGGSGPRVGAGLLRADSLPGAGGSPPRTPLLADFLGRSDQPAQSAPSTGAGAGRPAGAMGGAAPIGAMGSGGQSGGTRSSTSAVALPLDRDEDGDEEGDDDW